MTDLDTSAAASVFAIAFLVGAFFMLIAIRNLMRPQQQPTRTRPASSSRKAGRVSSGGGWS